MTEMVLYRERWVQRALQATAGLVTVLAAAWLSWRFLAVPVGWSTIFRPAGLAVATVGNPYQVPGFYNPPWVGVLLVPFALFPEHEGYVLFLLVQLALYVVALRRAGASWVGTTAVIINPVVIVHLLANVEGVVWFGMTFVSPLGILLALVKPQIGLPWVLYQLARAYQQKQIRGVVKLAWTLLLVFLPPGVIPWLQAMGAAPELSWNFSLFPWSLLAGLPLLAWAISRKREDIARCIGPLFAPYVYLASYAVGLLSLARQTKVLVALSAAVWIVFIITRFAGRG